MSTNRILVSVFRRGAAAWTNEFAPNTSIPEGADYRTINRFPTGHIAPQDLTPLVDAGGYGVNSAFTAFINHWKNVSYPVACFVTLGNENPTRSHFYEQDRLDCGGVPYARQNLGVYNRWSGLVDPPIPMSVLDLVTINKSPCRATIGLRQIYASASSPTPRLIPALVSLADQIIALAPLPTEDIRLTGRLNQKTALDTNVALTTLVLPASIPTDAVGAPKYPVGSPWGTRLRDTARMIIAGVKTRIFSVDFDGWDHHGSMGGTVNSPAGPMLHADLLATFNEGVNAFLHDMTASGNADRVTLLSQTEFHRTMRQNGNLASGSDHGQSSHAYVWGPTVVSGLYGAPIDYRENNATTYADVGSWQSPFNNRLLNGTMDYRALQLALFEWLTGRAITMPERIIIWGDGVPQTQIDLAPAIQRNAIGINP